MPPVVEGDGLQGAKLALSRLVRFQDEERVIEARRWRTGYSPQVFYALEIAAATYLLLRRIYSVNRIKRTCRDLAVAPLPDHDGLSWWSPDSKA